MSEDLHKKHLDESHERAIRQAMYDATDDLICRRTSRQEKKEHLETRLERIEQRLDVLELNR